MKRFFTILGGMGTAASMNFEKILNERTHATRDQDYYDYLLVNHASVPDRTAYILNHRKESFLPALSDDLIQQNLLKPNFIAMACNTAHYFYPELQAMTEIPILHMPFLVALEAVNRYPDQKSFGLLATKGTLSDHVYEKCFEILGREVILPSEELADLVMKFIYENVKQENQLDREFFNQILKRARDYFGVSTLILGCTELSYAADVLQITDNLLDSQSILVDRTLELAYAFRYQSAQVPILLQKMKTIGDQKGLLDKISD
ncbi:aspartate/glutamate racemase family protein [Xylocopilactobacillus apicola]|uniref:Aspartate racemase n=1 Tax=Xylocopilactobacillus apicola TaxID=2932184 RepID=A0AAU9DMD1_9LACO|nr:amino acid racemase [Xylocopilactobacillus apicola]BDR58092.1 aspartate racemase [Xylocopilactobacillus apicola]